jgi:hypothetical protein
VAARGAVPPGIGVVGVGVLKGGRAMDASFPVKTAPGVPDAEAGAGETCVGTGRNGGTPNPES